MMLVLARGTLGCGSEAHITTPCFAGSNWNRPPYCREISLAGNTLEVTRGTDAMVR
jgi:hypothetical protein